MKLSEPSLSFALDVARNLGFDMDIMSELLPIEILAIKQNLNDMTKTDNN